ncbi:MAG: hypothetical protein WAN36_11510, partial [Calditrichia bacterium]
MQFRLRIHYRFLLFLFVLSSSLYGNEADSVKSRSSLMALPYIYYTPETRFALGAGGIYTFRPKGVSLQGNPSSIQLSLTYTLRNQIIISLTPEIYLQQENYRLVGKYEFYKFPDRYWGIGNQTPGSVEEEYTQNLIKTHSNVQKEIFENFYLGFRYQAEWMKIVDTEPGGLLQKGRVAGSDGGFASGMGIITSFDSRDN